MAGIGWCGPLINLSSASSHIDDFVQLLVFVHGSNPVEYKLAKGGNVIRTDIQVGDETRPFFSVTLWNKHLASSVSAGDIILLQNVKVVKFGSVVEAKTVQYSSVLPLIHPYHSLLSKGVDELMSGSRVWGNAKEKLKRVIHWVQHTRITLCNELKGDQLKSCAPALRNWKVHETQEIRKCYLISEVLQLASHCKADFHASVGEIFLPSAGHDSDEERMFVSRRLSGRTDLAEDMICTGCPLCGSPLSSDSTSPSYCTKTSNRLHSVGTVYRPFMLYVWDASNYIPLFVKNKAAELLFGNIRAEKVQQSYKVLKKDNTCTNPVKAAAEAHKLKVGEKEVMVPCSSVRHRRSGTSVALHPLRSPDFYLVWLILLKMMLIQEKNSPLHFEVLVSPNLELEDGRFEMISISMPCLNNNVLSEANPHSFAELASRDTTEVANIETDSVL